MRSANLSDSSSSSARAVPTDAASVRPGRPPGPANQVSGPDADASPTRAPARLHHLDAVRAGALLLGIVLHSLLPFEPGGMWLFTDAQQAGWTSGVVFVIHLFRMVLFMMLAGYFARMVLHRRGAAAFLRDRTQRILLPLVVFGPIMLVAIISTVVGGVALELLPEPDAQSAEQSGGNAPGLLALLNPAHLWFLLVLMEAIVVTVALRTVLLRVLGTARAAAWSERIGTALAGPAGVLIAAVPYAAGILVQGVAMHGILQPTTVLPELAPTVAYVGAFLVGWFLHARTRGISHAASRWVWLLPAAAALTVAAFLTGWSALEGDAGMLVLVLAAAVQGLAAWAWVFALVGLAQKLLAGESRLVRYLADSSYWVYILHLPLLMALGIALAPSALPIPVKLLMTWTVTMAILVASYDLIVRPTWIGAWLNGRRRPRAIFAR